MREKYRHSPLLLFLVAGILCRFLSQIPAFPVQNTGLPLLKSILPAAHILQPVVVLPVLPAAIVHPRAVIQAADLICPNTGLHLAAIRAQAGPAPQANPPPPIALIPAVAPLPREGLRFPEVAAGRPVRK